MGIFFPYFTGPTLLIMDQHVMACGKTALDNLWELDSKMDIHGKGVGIYLTKNKTFLNCALKFTFFHAAMHFHTDDELI